MIDSTTEELLSLAEAARTVPGKSGRGVNPSTVWRWALRGVNGTRLEVLRLGGRTCTSRQALQRFYERCTTAAIGVTPTATPAIRRKAVEAAERELAADGI
jgi:hypothetical protein